MATQHHTEDGICVHHATLDCGIEVAVCELPGRRTVAAELRFLTGFVDEPEDKLGLSYIVQETIAKETAQRDGRGLFDAFDALGVKWNSWSGREASGYYFTCLSEFFADSLSLHAEYLTQPTFPADGVQVAADLTLDEIAHIEDDPQELSGVLFNRQVYGPILGRHVLGEAETVKTITREDVVAHWERFYSPGRMQVAIAGGVRFTDVCAQLEQLFGGWRPAERAGRTPVDYSFEQAFSHHQRDVEQVQIGICYPGATLDAPMRDAQRVAMALLAGGMSCRLFTELRERQGLVYWVTAWTEHPRGVGIVYLGGSSTPQNADKTYSALLSEVDRLGRDLDDVELQRAITGIVAKVQTRGDLTRAWCSEMADSLFHHGKIIPRSDKIARIKAVTVADVQAYLEAYPREHLNILTLGPAALAATTVNRVHTNGSVQ